MNISQLVEKNGDRFIYSPIPVSLPSRTTMFDSTTNDFFNFFNVSAIAGQLASCNRLLDKYHMVLKFKKQKARYQEVSYGKIQLDTYHAFYHQSFNPPLWLYDLPNKMKESTNIHTIKRNQLIRSFDSVIKEYPKALKMGPGRSPYRT